MPSAMGLIRMVFARNFGTCGRHHNHRCSKSSSLLAALNNAHRDYCGVESVAHGSEVAECHHRVPKNVAILLACCSPATFREAGELSVPAAFA
jgi:hypothetical protein